MRTRRFTKFLAASGLLVCCVATGASALDQGVAQIKSHPKHAAERLTLRNSKVMTAYTPQIAKAAEAPADAPQHSSLPLVLAGLTVAGASIARRSGSAL